MPFIDDNAVAEQRAKEACDVIDLLLKPGAGNQLWQMADRQPPADWPAYARLALQLCTRVMKVTTELVAECSRREQGNGEAVKEDLHPVQFLLPLLKRALSLLRYRDCSSWQKKVAWHATQQLATALSQLLCQVPLSQPASTDRVLMTELQLVSGQPIALLDTVTLEVDLSKLFSKLFRHKAVEMGVAIDADGWVALSDAVEQINGPRLRALVGNLEKLGSREYTEAYVRNSVAADDKRHFVINGTKIREGSTLGGGLGKRRLFLASADKSLTAQRLISNESQPLTFDQVDQTMLPWQTPSPESIANILEAAEHDLTTTIPALVQTVPSREVLSNEREQGKGGKAISSLIKRLRNVTPKTQGFATSIQAVVSLIIQRVELACDDDQENVALFREKAAKGKKEAKAMDEQEEKEEKEKEKLLDPSEKAERQAKRQIKSRDRLERIQQNIQADRDRELTSSLGRAVEVDKLPLENAVNDLTMDQLQNLGGLSTRSYAVSQQLLVHQNGAWHEQSVTQSARGSVQHQLEGSGAQLCIALHPWNHAPLVLPLDSFEALRSRHASTLRTQHASIVDALSGQRFDIFDQCVPIKVIAASEQASPMSEVGGLASWLLAAHSARRDAADTGPAACLLLTAPPAAGKTCLMSQLVMHVLQSKECDMVPILIKVQELQRHLLNESNRTIFERSWNWVDAFLQCVHGAGSDLYCMLRQALMARRALVLLDGIDEGGKARDAIERHVTEVLAPQGHIMLVTSRPAGVYEDRFRQHFVRVQLEPLSEAQQEEVIIKRLGKGEHSELLEYLRNPERVPLDYKTDQRVTGNPLMLSMVISIFQSKKGTDSAMPATITELYKTASKAMLERVDRKERGAAASTAAVPHLTSLLEAMFFEAHAAEARDFGEEQLNRAALALFAPAKLSNLDRNPDSYLNFAAELPTKANEVVRAVRERVAQDRLPLLSLLEAEPLLMRSSHLSFQEYFTVSAICTGKFKLPSRSPPWRWGAFWVNVVKLGRENGDRFRSGLLHAAGVEGNELNISGKLGGDRPTVLAVVCALLGLLRVLDLSSNTLGKGGTALADGLKGNLTLQVLK
jgi:hypothetical protein